MFGKHAERAVKLNYVTRRTVSGGVRLVKETLSRIFGKLEDVELHLFI
jgi:hypothetical protein